MRSTRALIYKNNLMHNLKTVGSFLRPKTKLCLAVKANGYGAGAITAANAAHACGAACVAVATVDEGIELRENRISCPILLLSLCSEDEVQLAVQHELSPLVCDNDYIAQFEKSAARAEKKIAVHLAIDTGMGRLGCAQDAAAALAQKIAAAPHLALAGTCTHFASSDEATADARVYTERQFADFVRAVQSMKEAGVNPGVCHCAASAATFTQPDMQLDMVRVGIAAYGYYGGEATLAAVAASGQALKPVMALQTQVSMIRRIHAGQYVSYGRTWKASHDTDIAVLPIGYADGLFRCLSSGCAHEDAQDKNERLHVAINGKQFPVVGRICMDQCMVELGSNSGVHRWDKAMIFGPYESGALQDAAAIAKMAGTIPYEILTSVSERVPRVVV
ncbi:MAG: alanine racemase [Treponema sp.]|nr:alanine racemase [Treponema sp.]